MTQNDKDPWTQIKAQFEKVSEIDNEPPTPEEASLSIMARMRRQLGEITLEEAMQRSSQETQLANAYFEGEAAGDDQEFKDKLGHLADVYLDKPPEVVYHPGSAQHVSAAEAFPEARVIFTDIDGDVEHDFIQRNIDIESKDRDGHPYEFYRADLHSFSLPEGLEADVVISMNTPSFTKEELDSVVRIGGIVLEGDTRKGDEWGADATSSIADYAGYERLERFAMSGDSQNVFFLYKRTY